MKKLKYNKISLLFIILSLLGYVVSGMSMGFVMSEVTTRILRNSVMVLSLIIPIIAGLGLNFAISVGALAAQASILFVLNWGLEGYTALIAVVIVATVIAVVTGYLIGAALNRVKGREMITSIIIGYIGVSVYQLIFMVGFGTVIPARNESLLLKSGVGIQHIVNLGSLSGIIDDCMQIRVGGTEISLLCILIILAITLFIHVLLKSKLGLNLKAVGESMDKSEGLGIDVNKMRIVAIIISTVLAAYGQIMYLQNIGMLSVYTAQSNREIFSSAAILAGGAGIKNASIRNVFIGLFLFHFLFVVSPSAGQNVFNSVAIGEYFRSFVSYAVICLAIIFNVKEQKEK